jgi:hypothetical protein
MKYSNLAVRMEQPEPSPAFEPASRTAALEPGESAANSRRRRPRPSLSFRAIVLRDQGLPLFRVR